MQRQEFSIEDIEAGRTMTLSDIGSMGAHVFECNKVRSAVFPVPCAFLSCLPPPLS
jgi:hypothetical protein